MERPPHAFDDLHMFERRFQALSGGVHGLYRQFPITFGCESCLLAGDPRRLPDVPQSLPLMPRLIARLPVLGPRREAVARDLLKTIQVSKVALDAIRSGRVGVTGSTGTVLSLGLDTAHDLAERLLSEVLAPEAPLVT